MFKTMLSVKPIALPRYTPKPTYKFKQHGINNKNRPIFISYLNGTEFDLSVINELKCKMLTSEHICNVHVFIKFAKAYKPSAKNIRFSSRRLFKLRTWSNQLKSLSKSHQIPELLYFTYVIGCKIIKYMEYTL